MSKRSSFSVVSSFSGVCVCVCVCVFKKKIDFALFVLPWPDRSFPAFSGSAWQAVGDWLAGVVGGGMLDPGQARFVYLRLQAVE